MNCFLVKSESSYLPVSRSVHFPSGSDFRERRHPNPPSESSFATPHLLATLYICLDLLKSQSLHDTNHSSDGLETKDQGPGTRNHQLSGV